MEFYLDGADADRLHPILDECVQVYLDDLDEVEQVAFKSRAKSFLRTYGFLASVLPYGHPEWEELSIFLTLLTPKLPAPKEEDLSQGILDSIDMDSYRVEKKAMQKIMLSDEEGEVDSVPVGDPGGRPETLLERLSNIIQAFNDLFGNIDWKDEGPHQKAHHRNHPSTGRRG